MNLHFFKILELTRSRDFDIPAPAPAKSFGSMRLRNTDRYHLLPAVMKGPQLVRLLGQGLGVLVVDPDQ